MEGRERLRRGDSPTRSRLPQLAARCARIVARLVSGALLQFLASTLAPSALPAQVHVPNGYEEGLFDVAAVGIAPSSVPVLVSPRGKFMLPVRALLEPIGVPFEIVLDSAVLHVARPA